MSSTPATASQQFSEGDPIEYDPIFLNSRREAIVIFCLWLTALIWAVPYCYLTGYETNIDPATFSTTWGIPTWLFWGILVPWIVADIFTVWFCFAYMIDDDLGDANEDTPATEGSPMHDADGKEGV